MEPSTVAKLMHLKQTPEVIEKLCEATQDHWLIEELINLFNENNTFKISEIFDFLNEVMDLYFEDINQVEICERLKDTKRTTNMLFHNKLLLQFIETHTLKIRNICYHSDRMIIDFHMTYDTDDSGQIASIYVVGLNVFIPIHKTKRSTRGVFMIYKESMYEYQEDLIPNLQVGTANIPNDTFKWDLCDTDLTYAFQSNSNQLYHIEDFQVMTRTSTSKLTDREKYIISELVNLIPYFDAFKSKCWLFSEKIRKLM